MKVAKVLYIDCQILQTQAFDRGMGKYTASLMSALHQNEKTAQYFNKVKIIINKNLQSDTHRLSYIKKTFPGAEMIAADIPTDTEVDTDEKYVTAQEVISELVSADSKANLEVSYLITSPFFVKFPAVFPKQEVVRKFCIVYDLIPFKIWFRQRIFPDHLYFKHFSTLLQADKLFTISQAVANDIHELLWVNSEKLQNIDGGPFEQNQKIPARAQPTNNPYIIFPSAPIVHKNNENAIKGFERFNKKHENKYKLVITSTFDEATQSRLNKLSQNIIFTGNITDEELVAYRRSADALLFASLSEGLGMPILEAVIDNIPVACSSIPVHREISEQAIYLFEPTSPKSIAQALDDAVKKKDWEIKSKFYPEIRNKYQWSRSADLLAGGLTASVNKNDQKQKLLLISPSARNDTPAGRLGELLWSALSETYEVSWQSVKVSGKHKRPAYVDELADKGIGQVEKVLIIGKAKLENIPPGTQIVRVNINRQRLFNRAPDDTIVVRARRIVTDRALKFSDWYFSTSDHRQSPDQIIDVIKGRLGNK